MTRRAAIGLSFLLCVSGGMALAELSRSPVPTARPGSDLQVLAVQPFRNLTGLGAYKPTPRPRGFSPAVAAAAPQVAVPAAPSQPVRINALRSPIPKPKPQSARRIAAPSTVAATPALQAAAPEKVNYRRKGSVCGVKDIRGSEISAIPGKLPGCGVKSPVQITEVAGVKLSSPARIDCTTAKALHSWIEKGVKPTVGRLGGGVSELRVAASFSCRTRNSQPGAKISEHGKGKAIDISAIRLKNGKTLSVLKGWNDPVQGKLLKRMHKSACGPFGTVLGPNSDRFHKDHFHFDTANYRSGSYCR